MRACDCIRHPTQPLGESRQGACISALPARSTAARGLGLGVVLPAPHLAEEGREHAPHAVAQPCAKIIEDELRLVGGGAPVALRRGGSEEGCVRETRGKGCVCVSERE